MLSRLALRNAGTRWAPLLARTTQTQAIETAAVTANLQRKSRPLNPGPVRHGFIPEEWFQFFHPKTGASGPYMFLFGVSTWLVSKEIYVLEHEFFTGIAIIITCMLVVKKAGPAFKEMMDKELTKYENELDTGRIEERKAYVDAIDFEKREQWRSAAQQMIMDAKKENIKMQLESAYRERISTVYREVKKRLDYQLQIASVNRRISQKHMVSWIINNVIKSITPEQEKAALQQCIADLQALAPK